MKRVPSVAVITLLAGHVACGAGGDTTLATAVELDHVYLYAPQRSEEAGVVGALASAGLNVQPERNDFGDGVIGRYVFFENAYLELLWYDGTTATDPDTRRRAAWESSGASPFGVGMRRREGVPDALPFPTRPFTAPWMRPGTQIRLLGAEDEVIAPDLFVVPDYMVYRRTGSHPLGVRRVTGARVTVQPAGLTDAARLVGEGRVVAIEIGTEPALLVTFDDGLKGDSTDLRPLLPLKLSY